MILEGLKELTNIILLCRIANTLLYRFINGSVNYILNHKRVVYRKNIFERQHP